MHFGHYGIGELAVCIWTWWIWGHDGFSELAVCIWTWWIW